MSLPVAVPFGVASAVVYGVSIVVQHRVAQEQADDRGESAAGLLRLIKHPVFLLAIAGDVIGFLLQVIALATGPVVVIQPLLVLMLPVALATAFTWFGRRPERGEYLGVVAVVGGLALFLALIGSPSEVRVPPVRYLAITVVIVLAAATAMSLAVTGRDRVTRGAVYGTAAGVCFGTLAVLIDAASQRMAEAGVVGLFDSPRGLVPVGAAFVAGVAGTILTQLSFQVGALGATLPANLAADPLTAVLLGALVLREYLPFDVLHLVLYTLCLAGIVAGAIRLANPSDGGVVSRPQTDDARAAASPRRDP